MNTKIKILLILILIIICFQSPLSYAENSNYIHIPDPLFLKVLNKNIDANRPDDHPITENELLKLKQLSIYLPTNIDITNVPKGIKRIAIIPERKINEKFMVSRGLKSIEGLQYAKNLEAIELSECEISDLSPLSSLTKLKYIEVDRNRIIDLNPLKNLPSLEHLKLYNNLITDVSPLNNLNKLNYLDIHFNTDNNGNNGITDISSLKNLVNLEFLDISANHISNIDVINHLPKLNMIDFSGNNISDYANINDKIVHLLSLGEGNCGFFGQNININQTFNLNANENIIKIKNPYKKLNDLAKTLFEVDTFFMELSPHLDWPKKTQLDIFEKDKIVKELVEKVTYNLDTDEFIIAIKPNETPRIKNYALIIRAGIESYAWDINGINIIQSPKNDNDIIDVSEETKAFFIQLLNKYSKLYKKYTNIIDSEQKTFIPKKKTDPITVGDLKKLKIFYVNNQNISEESVYPLRYAINLEEFKVELNDKKYQRNLNGFDFLKHCKKLKIMYYLNQDYKNATYAPALNLNGLKHLNSIKDIRINKTETSDLSPIKKLNLINLSLEENKISDLSFLKDMATLERLDLENNNIKDLTGISNLINLKTLYLYGNNIKDISPLSKLKNLQALLLQSNNIYDITPIENLNLYRLRIQDNPLNFNYMNVIKKIKNLNHICVDKINIDDFNWLQKNLLRPEKAIPNIFSENTIRQVSFENLIYEVEIDKDLIENKSIEIDNPFVDAKNIPLMESNDENLKFIVEPNKNKIKIDLNKILIFINEDIEQLKDLEFKIEYEQTYIDDMFGEYYQPASIEGNINLKIKFVNYKANIKYPNNSDILVANKNYSIEKFIISSIDLPQGSSLKILSGIPNKIGTYNIDCEITFPNGKKQVVNIKIKIVENIINYPQTGDNISLQLYAWIVLLAIILSIKILKKKQN